MRADHPDVTAPTQPPRRYGSRGQVALRWLMTTVVALPALGLFISMAMIARSDDPRAAAMDFFLLGLYLMIAVPVGWHLWRPTTKWQSARRERWLLERKLQDQLRIDRLQQDGPEREPNGEAAFRP